MLLKSFEVQALLAGAWKINAIFDDQELALFEARRMAESGRYAGIRVVAEEFNQNTQEGRSRTIFRSSKVEKANAESVSQRGNVRRAALADRDRRQVKKGVRVRVRRSQRRKRALYRIIWLFFMLVVAGVSALAGLHFLRLYT